MSMLGLLSYYQSYVTSFSDIARRFIELTKKRAPNEISLFEQCNKALNKLKYAIIKSPIWHFQDIQKLFVIHVYASSKAIGDCLSQKYENELEHMIVFSSKKLAMLSRKLCCIRKGSLHSYLQYKFVT